MNNKSLSSRFLVRSTVLAAICTFILFSSACEHTPLPGETYRKVANAWPIFDQEKTAGVTEDGGRWEKEKGDACVWLSTWEKEKRYDKDGFLIYRKEKDAFFPFYWSEEEENEEFREHKSAVLFLFPYYSRQAKSAETEEKNQ